MAKKILVIDDDHMVVRTLAKLLEREGYFVVTVESGGEAVTLASDTDFDLIISDIRMPDKDGVETLNEIQKVLSVKDKTPPPFIFITGYAEQKINESAQEMHPAGFLYKPFDKDAFLNSIQEALKG